MVDFHQTACLNRGINEEVFTDREEAIAWLTAQKVHETRAGRNLAL